MKLVLLAAALAAIAAPLPAASTVAEASHIRTTLYGTKGRPIVLLPGLSTPGAVWTPMAEKLAADHRVLVVEVKGFDGVRTPANEKDGLIDGIVTEIAADIGRRNLKAPVIAGHSFGGLVAMQFALAKPGVAKSMVVVDALPFFGTVFDEKATMASIEPRAQQMRSMMIAQADVIRAAGAKGVAKDPGGTMSIDAERRIAISNWSMKADPATVAQAMWEDLQLDLRPAIGRITVPMTVLYQAAEDPAFAAKRYRADYAAKADTKLVPVAATGHFIQLDQPQAVEAAIRDSAR